MSAAEAEPAADEIESNLAFIMPPHGADVERQRRALRLLTRPTPPEDLNQLTSNQLGIVLGRYAMAYLESKEPLRLPEAERSLGMWERHLQGSADEDVALSYDLAESSIAVRRSRLIRSMRELTDLKSHYGARGRRPAAPEPPPRLERRSDWRTVAACKGSGDMFYPERGDTRSIEAAKTICQRCDVSEECLEFALEAGDIFGIWGGLTPKERRKLQYARKVTT